MATHRKTRQRHENENQLRFLTFSCFNRLRLFDNDAIKSAFVDQLRTTQDNTHFKISAWVIMPEHVHLLLMPNLPDHPIDDVLNKLKGPFAKRVLARWRELKAPILSCITDSKGNQSFWQSGGGYDRNIYSAEEALEKWQYIHDNPVKRRLVAHATDWIWSSARFFATGKDDWNLPISTDLV